MYLFRLCQCRWSTLHFKSKFFVSDSSSTLLQEDDVVYVTFVTQGWRTASKKEKKKNKICIGSVIAMSLLLQEGKINQDSMNWTHYFRWYITSKSKKKKISWDEQGTKVTQGRSRWISQLKTLSNPFLIPNDQHPHTHFSKLLQTNKKNLVVNGTKTIYAYLLWARERVRWWW